MNDRVRKLVGQVISTGIPGPRLDRQTRRVLDHLWPSGIILFERNVESVNQLRDLTRELHALPSRPLISIDHEGGPVLRLGPPFTQFPAAARVGRDGAADLAYAIGQAMGVELASVDIDINFAPVLDVNSNRRNPIIGERAFASTPEHVATASIAFLRGLLAGGVLPCGKHFPGHGDTDRDSHLELPIVRRSRAGLERTELPPFRAAIAAHVPMLMTAHVLYEDLDDRDPATLSRYILHDLLRQQLRFRGVVVSDDLQMRAVSAKQSVADAALASLRAGVDWLLICNDLDQSCQVGERLVTAVATGELDGQTLAASAGRVGNLTVPQRPHHTVSLPVAEHGALNRRIHGVGNTTGLNNED